MSLRTSPGILIHDPYKMVENKTISILWAAKVTGKAVDPYLQLRLFSERPVRKRAIC